MIALSANIPIWAKKKSRKIGSNDALIALSSPEKSIRRKSDSASQYLVSNCQVFGTEVPTAADTAVPSAADQVWHKCQKGSVPQSLVPVLP